MATTTGQISNVARQSFSSTFSSYPSPRLSTQAIDDGRQVSTWSVDLIVAVARCLPDLGALPLAARRRPSCKKKKGHAGARPFFSEYGY